MHCLVEGCGGDTRVLESRLIHDRTRRRRCCNTCGHRFTTYESVPSASTRLDDETFYRVVTGLLTGIPPAAVAFRWNVQPDQVERVLERLKAAYAVNKARAALEPTEPAPDPT